MNYTVSEYYNKQKYGISEYKHELVEEVGIQKVNIEIHHEICCSSLRQYCSNL